jgi:hypothetical protein
MNSIIESSIIEVSMIASALATVGMPATAVSAESPWQASHLRRVEVSGRVALQNFPIRERVATNRISRFRTSNCMLRIMPSGPMPSHAIQA